MSEREIKKARELIGKLNRLALSYVPMPPLKPSDEQVVIKYLRSRGISPKDFMKDLATTRILYGKR